MRYLAIAILFATSFPQLAGAVPDEREAETKAIQVETDLAQQLFRQGKSGEAIEAASKLVKQFPKRLEPLAFRSALYGALSRFDEAIKDATAAIKIKPVRNLYQSRGVLNFKAGHFKASVKDFDKALEDRPDEAPHHWQRGISHYYAGMFKEGIAQFEIHKKVNPEDVENAIWHYLCKAKVDGVKKARAALIPIKADTRPWADSAYRLFQGKLSPDDMLKAMAKDADAQPRHRDYILFYTHLYIGLFHEAEGNADLAKKHILLAANKYPSTHYMGDVARVHAKLFDKKKQEKGGDQEGVEEKKREGDANPKRGAALWNELFNDSKSIVFVVDGGASMLDVWPFASSVLSEAIETLSRRQRFTVYVYQGDKVIEADPKGLRAAIVAHKEESSKWLEKRPFILQGRGDCLAGLRAAFAMKPQAIVVMTDSIVRRDAIEKSFKTVHSELATLNKKKTPIHMVQILYQQEVEQIQGRQPMAILASEHGGQYVFISPKDLGIR